MNRAIHFHRCSAISKWFIDPSNTTFSLMSVLRAQGALENEMLKLTKLWTTINCGKMESIPQLDESVMKSQVSHRWVSPFWYLHSFHLHGKRRQLSCWGHNKWTAYYSLPTGVLKAKPFICFNISKQQGVCEVECIKDWSTWYLDGQTKGRICSSQHHLCCLPAAKTRAHCTGSFLVMSMQILQF